MLELLQETARRDSMRYIMKQKLFSWGKDFYIKDETGRDVFFVDGEAFSFGDQLSFQDLAGNVAGVGARTCAHASFIAG
jgi:uncharacterized protein YxjI